MSPLQKLQRSLETPEGWWTVASNLIPVIGVLAFGWQALPLMIYYWIENVLIGAFNVPKILIASLTKPAPQNWLSLVLAPFFVVHYGLFCFVHGAFIFAIFAGADLIAGRAEPTTDTFDVLGRVTGMLRDNADLRWSVIALVIVLTFRFIWLWLARAAWRGTDATAQMYEPYGRVIVLHLTIMVVAVPVLLIGQPMIAVLGLAIFKTALELGLPFVSIPATSASKAS